MGIAELFSEEIKNFSAHVGIFFDSGNGETFCYHGDDEFKAASLIKIPLCLTFAAWLRDKGADVLQEKYPLAKENIVGGTGIMHFLNREYVPTFRELIFFAISQSDNTATNQMVDMAGGFEPVNRLCQGLSLKHTRMQRKMMDLTAAKEGKENFTSAGDMGALLCRVRDSIASGEEAPMMQLIFDSMKQQMCRNKLPVLLPAEAPMDTLHKSLPGNGKVIIANKTGDLWSTQHDCGIFVLPSGTTYVLSVCTDQLKDEQEGCRFISRVSRIAYDYMKGK